MQEIMSYAWPGNVRELRNAADRMVLGLPFREGVDRGAEQRHPCAGRAGGPCSSAALIEDALAASGGRAAAASERLKIPTKTLYDKLKRRPVSERVQDRLGRLVAARRSRQFCTARADVRGIAERLFRTSRHLADRLTEEGPKAFS